MLSTELDCKQEALRNMPLPPRRLPNGKHHREDYMQTPLSDSNNSIAPPETSIDLRQKSSEPHRGPCLRKKENKRVGTKPTLASHNQPPPPYRASKASTGKSNGHRGVPTIPWTTPRESLRNTYTDNNKLPYLPLLRRRVEPRGRCLLLLLSLDQGR